MSKDSEAVDNDLGFLGGGSKEISQNLDNGSKNSENQ